METANIILAIVFILFTALLELNHARNRKKHRQKIQLLEEIIITLTINELSLQKKMQLSAEIDEILKKKQVKLMHGINDLQHELFKIISGKNKEDGVR